MAQWSLNQESPAFRHGECQSIGGSKTGHPAVFPLQLAIDQVVTWSNQGDIVLDPFMGSGTTGLACIQNDRQFIGIEISDKYVQIAKERCGISD